MRGARSGGPTYIPGYGYGRLSGSIARGNRHTDKPHAHNRERERRARQAARTSART